MNSETIPDVNHACTRHNCVFRARRSHPVGEPNAQEFLEEEPHYLDISNPWASADQRTFPHNVSTPCRCEDASESRADNVRRVL